MGQFIIARLVEGPSPGVQHLPARIRIPVHGAYKFGGGGGVAVLIATALLPPDFQNSEEPHGLDDMTLWVDLAHGPGFEDP